KAEGTPEHRPGLEEILRTGRESGEAVPDHGPESFRDPRRLQPGAARGDADGAFVDQSAEKLGQHERVPGRARRATGKVLVRDTAEQVPHHRRLSLQGQRPQVRPGASGVPQDIEQRPRLWVTAVSVPGEYPY